MMNKHTFIQSMPSLAHFSKKAGLFLAVSFFMTTLVFQGSAQTYVGDLYITEKSEVDAFNYTEVTGNLYIYDFGGDIDNLDGLSELETVGGSLEIEQLFETSNCTMPSLSSVTEIRIVQCTFTEVSFPSLNAVSNLTLIDIFITSLDGLSSISSVGTVNISYNPDLNACCGAWEFLENMAPQDVTIEFNGTGCESYSAIEQECAPPNPDADGDGINDVDDNCPTVPNADQSDIDFDGIGDVCDATLSVCDAIDGLIGTVEGLELPNGLENALVSKLEGALSKFQSGNNNAAVGKLNAFINQVNAQSGNQIDPEDADALIAVADAIVDAIEGGNTDCTSGGQNIIVPTNNGMNTMEKVTYLDLSMEVYPNPTNGLVNIQMNELEEVATLTIFDQLGRKVWSQEMEEGQQNIQLDLTALNLKQGIYLVRLNTANDHFTKRLVLTK